MTHPLRAWLTDKGISVVAFCDGAPFSHVTVYKLLKLEGEFGTKTIIDIAAETGGEVSEAQLLDHIKRNRELATREAAE